MKRLLRNIALLLLPILLYYALFIVFEPNNYFGLRKSATGTNIMATLRAYQNNPGNAIILGDSRTAKFDLDEVQRLTGVRYDNLSYGGASLKEQLDVLDFALTQNPELKQVVFGLSFYTLNKGYNHDRMVIQALNNPFVYLTNLGYNINMLTTVLDHFSPDREVGDKDETQRPEDYKYVEYTEPVSGETTTLRKTIADHLYGGGGGVAPRSVGWELNEAQLARLLETIDACAARGITFVVVLPPMHEDVRHWVVEPYGIDGAPLRGALAALNASPALVEDYEFAHPGALGDTDFYDGFHLDIERGLPKWTEMLFSDIARQTGEAA